MKMILVGLSFLLVNSTDDWSVVYEEYRKDDRVIRCVDTSFKNNRGNFDIDDQRFLMFLRQVIEEVCIETYFMIDNQITIEGIPV